MLRSRVFLVVLVSALVLAACQPIVAPSAEPEVQQEGAKQVTEAPPGFTRYDFTNLGISVAFPDGWIVRQDPKYDWVIALSEQPETMRGYTPAYWMPAFEEAITSVNIQMRDAATFSEDSLSDIVLKRFQNYSSAEFQINPKGGATVISGPDPVTIGGYEGVQLVIEGIDDNLRFPFRSHISAVQNGDHIVFLVTSMTEANQADQLPVVDQIAATLEVMPPVPATSMVDNVHAMLTLDAPVTGSLVATKPTKNSRDLWPFSGSADQQMTLIVAPLGDKLDLIIDVLNTDGESILNDEVDVLYIQTGSREKVTFRLPADGDYMAVARGAFQTEGDYQLTLYEGFRAY